MKEQKPNYVSMVKRTACNYFQCFARLEDKQWNNSRKIVTESHWLHNIWIHTDTVAQKPFEERERGNCDGKTVQFAKRSKIERMNGTTRERERLTQKKP